MLHTNNIKQPFIWAGQFSAGQCNGEKCYFFKKLYDYYVSADLCRGERYCTVNMTTCHYLSPLTFPFSSVWFIHTQHVNPAHDTKCQDILNRILMKRGHLLSATLKGIISCRSAAMPSVQIAPVCFLRHSSPSTAIIICPPTQFPCLRLQCAVIL